MLTLEISLHYSDVQKMFTVIDGINNISDSCTKSHKRFEIQCELLQKMAFSVFAVILDVLFLFY